jgi:hypothetical protein
MLDNSHLSAERLERYALQRLAGAECAELEAHLLICSNCREELTGIDDYIAVIKAALTSMPVDTAYSDSLYPLAAAVGAQPTRSVACRPGRLRLVRKTSR